MVHNIPRKEEDKINDEYRNSSSEHPPQGAYLFQTHLSWWSLIEMGAYFRGGGGGFKFSKHDGINFSQRPRIQSGKS